MPFPCLSRLHFSEVFRVLHPRAVGHVVSDVGIAFAPWQYANLIIHAFHGIVVFCIVFPYIRKVFPQAGIGRIVQRIFSFAFVRSDGVNDLEKG